MPESDFSDDKNFSYAGDRELIFVVDFVKIILLFSTKDKFRQQKLRKKYW